MTDAGRRLAQATAVREGQVLEAEVRRFHARFPALDRVLKETVTRWQIRSVGGIDVPNDHLDPGHDRAVLADLDAIVSDAVALLAPLAQVRSRYRRYGERLRESMDRALAGEVGGVGGIARDSVHSVWWQLHSDLLAVLGRTRGAAEA